MDNTLLGATRVTVGAAKTLPVLLAAGVGNAKALLSGMRRLVILPASGVDCHIGLDGNVPDVTYPTLPTQIDMPEGGRDAKSLRIFSAAGGVVDIFQFGNRIT